MKGMWVCLAMAIASAASADAKPPADKLMPDGKRWTLENLRVDIAGSHCYENSPQHCERYGKLYTWTAAQEACRSLGPAWRLPSMDDWKALARHYGGLSGDGDSDGRTAYREMLVGGKSGLEMLLGGGRNEQESRRLEAHGFYWSTTEQSSTIARLVNFGKGSGKVFDQDGGEKTTAYSVRCVADR